MVVFIKNMGRKSELNDTEKKTIVQLLNKGQNVLETSKLLCRDHRTIIKFIDDGNTN